MMVPVTVGLLVLSPPVRLFVFVVWLVVAALVVCSVVMAVLAWRGHEVADGPGPRWLAGQVPEVRW